MSDETEHGRDGRSSAGGDAGERAVREYLMWITDPASLVDEALIAQLEEEAGSASDPIVKLRALSRLEQARAVDGERFKLAFIQHAGLWAEENGISESAFRELGVDETILRAAGIGLSSRRPSSTARRPAPAPRPAGAARARSVPSAQIKAEVSAWDGEFTLSDVVAKVGGSPMTVRKAVEDLVEEGAVRRLGPARDHAGRGRAPIVYRVS